MNTGVTKEMEGNFDLIEGLNGANFRDANVNAVYWASRAGKSMTGGSDGHSTFELGKALTFTRGHDIDSIFKDVLKGKSVIVGDENNVFLKAVVGVVSEFVYVKRSNRENMTKILLKGYFGNEYRNINSKFKDGKVYRMFVHPRVEAAKKKNLL